MSSNNNNNADYVYAVRVAKYIYHSNNLIEYHDEETYSMHSSSSVAIDVAVSYLVTRGADERVRDWQPRPSTDPALFRGRTEFCSTECFGHSPACTQCRKLWVVAVERVNADEYDEVIEPQGIKVENEEAQELVYRRGASDERWEQYWEELYQLSRAVIHAVEGYPVMKVDDERPLAPTVPNQEQNAPVVAPAIPDREQEEPVVAHAPKRGRGRPRRRPLPDAVEGQQQPQKKPRGRPRKDGLPPKQGGRRKRRYLGVNDSSWIYY